jgi:hypothetical protein
MKFNIRAIALVDSVSADARVELADFVGKRIEFRAGVTYSITLPKSKEEFAALGEPERLLTGLSAWARVYRYPDEDGEKIHVLAPYDDEAGGLGFYRLDFKQLMARHGPRPAVEILGMAVMTYDETATWLIDLAYNWALKPDQKARQFCLVRPGPIQSNPVRLAWVGPEIVGNIETSHRLDAIAQVYGADIVSVAPRSFRDVEARLAGVLPLHGVVVCQRYAPYITDNAVHISVDRSLIHFCNSVAMPDLEIQARTWIEICEQAIEIERKQRPVDETKLLLAIMLRGMLSHAKIGQFNHCQKQTLLTGVRARRLNVAVAEGILDQNSEAHHDTKDSGALFLWKEHNDGKQYFLNPSRVEQCRILSR